MPGMKATAPSGKGSSNHAGAHGLRHRLVNNEADKPACHSFKGGRQACLIACFTYLLNFGCSYQRFYAWDDPVQEDGFGFLKLLEL
jgi:hypothetical protein